jgi:hypothetical protein
MPRRKRTVREWTDAGPIEARPKQGGSKNSLAIESTPFSGLEAGSTHHPRRARIGCGTAISTAFTCTSTANTP